MITERSAIGPDEQIAFAREMKVLTKAIWGGFVFFIWGRNFSFPQEHTGTTRNNKLTRNIDNLGLDVFC